VVHCDTRGDTKQEFELRKEFPFDPAHVYKIQPAKFVEKQSLRILVFAGKSTACSQVSQPILVVREKHSMFGIYVSLLQRS
jgi:hypothetical protein